MWNTADLSSRPIASASADYIGQFIWSEYWGKWDEVLGCDGSGSGGTLWTVRGLDDGRVRRHSTAVPVDCIHAAPDVVGGAHRPPLALPNLAVLRAAVERVATQRYFGSAVGLGHWLADTRRRGLVRRLWGAHGDRRPTVERAGAARYAKQPRNPLAGCGCDGASGS